MMEINYNLALVYRVIHLTLHVLPPTYGYLPTDLENDDLIFSGMFSGCGAEQSSDCVNQDGVDWLIVPHTGPQKTTSVPHVSQQPPIEEEETNGSGSYPCNGDDEDCGNGSGYDKLIDNEHTIHPSPDFTFPEVVEYETHEVILPPDIEVIDTASKPGQGPSDTIFQMKNVIQDNSNGKRVTVDNNRGTTYLDIKESITPPYLRETIGSENSLSINIGLIIGIGLGVVLLFLLLAYALFKYRRRDERAYKIGETSNYRYETVSTAPPVHVNSASEVTKALQPACAKANKNSVKEWYV